MCPPPHQSGGIRIFCALQPRGRREESLQAAQVEELLSDAAGDARVARGGEAGCVQDRLLRTISAHLV